MIDTKNTIYKLGLLRSIALLAVLVTAMVRSDNGDDDVVLPQGAVALNWLRMYLPLVSASLPQSPTNAGPDGLGFVGDAFRRLLGGGIAATDLRIGASLTGERTPRSASLVLDGESLSMFGSITVPDHVWRAIQRLGAWIEPVLVAEWARLTREYSAGQGKEIGPGLVEAALAWPKPNRDVKVAREIALAAIETGDLLHCVWVGNETSGAGPLMPEAFTSSSRHAFWRRSSFNTRASAKSARCFGVP